MLRALNTVWEERERKKKTQKLCSERIYILVWDSYNIETITVASDATTGRYIPASNLLQNQMVHSTVPVGPTKLCIRQKQCEFVSSTTLFL